MSEYVDIRIKNLSLFWFRNYLDKEIVELFFSKDDLIISPNCISDPEDIDSAPFTRYLYKTTVKKSKERLDAMGYGLNSLEKLFNEKKANAIDYDSFLSHLHVRPDAWHNKAQERVEKYVTFKKWSNSMNKIINFELEHGSINSFNNPNELNISTECDKIVFYALLDQDSESFYAINPEIIQKAFIIRLILESCTDEDEIVLDFSCLANWSDDCIPKALEATGNAERIIVLVEGASDKNIIEFSLKKLYPHLADLFYFMDFSDDFGNRREGGASEIRKHMEAFFYSKLPAKFIAVFDNDAVGYHNKYILLNEKIKNWGENFRIKLYPDVLSFRKYPTVAPNGNIILDDINRKACSIELYLPDDIIMNEGSYLPIEWENREKIKKFDETTEFLYQGVISEKDTIKKRFNNMKNKIGGEQAFIPEDWERMKLLLGEIVFAFS